MVGLLSQKRTKNRQFYQKALQTEIRRHTFDTFVDEPPSIAQGGNGVVTPGCPACRKRLFTMANFLDHLADEVLPGLIENLSVNK
jgi:hypothetical protein